MSELLQVGQPHPSQKPPVPAGAFFNWSAGGLELLLSLDGPTAREVEAARIGPCEFALVPFGPALFLVYRFAESLPWSDAPYTPHLLAEDRGLTFRGAAQKVRAAGNPLSAGRPLSVPSFSPQKS
jgi:hypothetical protein